MFPTFGSLGFCFCLSVRQRAPGHRHGKAPTPHIYGPFTCLFVVFLISLGSLCVFVSLFVVRST